jgi:ATP-dependent RNA helicase DDX35
MRVLCLFLSPAVPEMQRSDLAGTVLQLKALGIDNIMTFEWLAPPPAEVRAGWCGQRGHHGKRLLQPSAAAWVRGNGPASSGSAPDLRCDDTRPWQTMIRALEALHALGALDGDARLARPLGQQVGGSTGGAGARLASGQ